MSRNTAWFITYEVDLVNHKTKRFNALLIGQHPVDWLYDHRREHPRANTILLFYHKSARRFEALTTVIDKREKEVPDDL